MAWNKGLNARSKVDCPLGPFPYPISGTTLSEESAKNFSRFSLLKNLCHYETAGFPL